jgi:hypothetical protein
VSICGRGAEFAQRILGTVGAAQPTTATGAGREIGVGRPVQVAGHAAPGPQGLLTAPISGRQCVWYRVARSPFKDPAGTVGMHKYEAKVPAYVPSSSAPPAQMSTQRRFAQQIEDSHAPFVVVDETGRVEIDPDDAIVDSDVVTTNELRHGDERRSITLVQEWIIPPDQQLLAYGVPSRIDPADASGRQDGSLVRLAAADPVSLLVSTHEQRYIEGRANETMHHSVLGNPKAIAWRVGGVVVAFLVIGWTLLALALTGVI